MIVYPSWEHMHFHGKCIHDGVNLIYFKLLTNFFGWIESFSAGTLLVIVASWRQRTKLSFLKHRFAASSKTPKGLHMLFQTGLGPFRTILLWASPMLNTIGPFKWQQKTLLNQLNCMRCLKTIRTVSPVRKLIRKQFFGILPRRFYQLAEHEIFLIK